MRAAISAGADAPIALAPPATEWNQPPAVVPEHGIVFFAPVTVKMWISRRSPSKGSSVLPWAALRAGLAIASNVGVGP